MPTNEADFSNNRHYIYSGTARAPLVSVIIPCYNAEQWVAEAIESSLAQTYEPVQTIVIDDGSTDRSLEVISRFKDHVKFETGPNKGANYARNRGFILSKGEYIQWLDADDTIAPGKLENQAGFLQHTRDDVVFGDWRIQYHKKDNTISLGEVIHGKQHPDILESLLGGWWASSAAYLMKREVVEAIGGWDETLPTLQDLDFYMRIAILGVKVGYQPGIATHYRKCGELSEDGANTVSGKGEQRLDVMGKLLDKYSNVLREKGQFHQKYNKSLAKSYFILARGYFKYDKHKSFEYLKTARSLDKTFSSKAGSKYNLCLNLFGFALTERLLRAKRRILGT